MKIKHKLFGINILQFILLGFIVYFIVMMNTALQSIINDEVTNQEVYNRVKTTSVMIKDYFSKQIDYPELRANYSMLSNAFNNKSLNEDVKITLESVFKTLDATEALVMENDNYETQVMKLTSSSIQQSSEYTNSTALSLADESLKDKVSKLERLVLISANQNTIANYEIKTLFYKLKEDLTTKDPLLNLINESIANAEIAITDLQDTPFAELPKASLQSSNSLKELVTKYVRNAEAINENASKVSTQIGALLENLDTQSISSTKDIMNHLNQSILVFFIILLAIIGIIILVNLLLARYMSKELKMLNKLFAEVAEGNLTKNASSKRKDELAELGRSFNKMIDNLKSIIQGTVEVSGAIEETSEMLVAIAAGASESMMEVERAITEIAEGATTQAEKSQESVRNVESLDEDISILDSYSEDTYKATEEMMKMNRRGLEVIEDLISKQKQSGNAIERINTVIDVLGNQINAISEFTVTIESIAEQTNLLALNAAIEAARAGDHGKGFAVVADEVRKLAEGSSLAAKEIQEVINKVNIDAKEAFTSVKEAKEVFKRQNHSVNDTGAIFRSLETTTNNSISKIQNMYEEIKKIDVIKNRVIEIINTINAISTDTAAATEEVSALAVEQNNSMSNISVTIKDLSQKAKDLKTSVERFKM